MLAMQTSNMEIYISKRGFCRQSFLAKGPFFFKQLKCYLLRKGKYSSPFNLKKYFEQNDSYTPKTIKKVEEVRSTQTYSPNQQDYSREYRKACHHKCQLCSVDCSKFTGLLHMHHIDGNPANNPTTLLNYLFY